MKNKKTSSVHVNGILNKINIQLKDEEYTNEKSIQNFICSACSHSWQDKLSSFLNKKKPKGCPNCSYSRWSNYSISRYLLEYNIPFTLTSGQTIKNGAQIVQFQCTRNHIINKPFYELKAYFSRRQKNGNYCEECRATEFKQLALKNCKEKYKTKKHVILKDIQWNDRRCILFFDCKKGHSFSTDKITFTNKFYKKDFSGCMICDSQNWNIEKIKKTIKDSEFKVELLTNHYKNNHTPMDFKCLECKTINHSAWGDVLRKIKKNKDKTSCKKCHDKKITTWSIPLINAELIKKKIKIRCIEDKYSTNKKSMRWKCLVCLNIWKNNWKAINHSDQGCPTCAFVGKTETAIRVFLESVFKLKFQKIRPSWLVNPETGRNLEVDCWNESLKLGIEINGEHHFKQMKYDKDDSRFKKIQIKDKFKIKRFKELGLTLIPFCIYKVKKTDMKDSLKKALIESGVSIPKTWESTSL